jgi:hypothetical protein
MRAFCSLGLMTVLCLAGCGQQDTKTTQTTNAPAPNGGSQPAGGYLGALANGEKLAVKTVDVASVNQAIQMFNVAEGRFPKDLNELVETKYLHAVPAAPYGMKIEYDAAAGSVRVVPQ